MLENRKGVESLGGGVRAWEVGGESSGWEVWVYGQGWKVRGYGRGKCLGMGVESAWVKILKVLGKFGGKGLGMRAWKVLEGVWAWKVRGKFGGVNKRKAG